MAILKPLKVNIDNVDLDTIELFEQVSDKAANDQRIKAGDVKRLFAAMFENWTEADAGKVTRLELPEVLRALSEAFDTAVPLESAAS